jgi:dimeric dUTPase (all-alpha-NTP-PPase superfamily)
MRLKIDELRELQAALDARIFKQHETSRTATRSDRCLALCVEIGELANETRCFKYWSERPSSPKDVLLEELEDSIHFLLSLGIDLNDSSQVIEGKDDQLPLSLTFLDFYRSSITLLDDFTLENYIACFAYICILAEKLGFSEAELTEYYLRKNQKNHHRQDTHY